MSQIDVSHISADAAAGAMPASILGKRPAEEIDHESSSDIKKLMTDFPPNTSGPPMTTAMDTTVLAPPTTPVAAATSTTTTKATTSKSLSKVREIRLEQNRKAARESRRRKKVMIEELQRSVIFFSRANSTLKQQNDELGKMLLQAQAHVQAHQNQGIKKEDPIPVANTPAVTTVAVTETNPSVDQQRAKEQAEANAVATQAMYESQGFPAAAARAVAQTLNAPPAPPTVPTVTPPTTTTVSAQHQHHHVLPPMQPGATMQAMANFQQAAAAAMQAAMQGMASIPGVNLSMLAATPATGVNANQVYTDTMTALAMQQAAAAAGQHFLLHHQPAAAYNPIANPMMAWGTAVPGSTTVQPAQNSAPAAITPQPTQTGAVVQVSTPLPTNTPISEVQQHATPAPHTIEVKIQSDIKTEADAASNPANSFTQSQ